MPGELDQNQIDAILRSESIGRIGCYQNGKTYIVLIHYVYDGAYVYAHSIDGMKVRMMRTNPEVCFQVDRIVNLSNWQSIITWGTFEELTGEEAAAATYMLAQRPTTLIASGLSLHDMKLTDSSRQKMIIYRIHLHEKTGRVESTLSYLDFAQSRGMKVCSQRAYGARLLFSLLLFLHLSGEA